MAYWDFVIPVCEPKTKYIVEDICVAYNSGLPNDLVVEHISSSSNHM